MEQHLLAIIDALDNVKLLPRHSGEQGVLYGFVPLEHSAAALPVIVQALEEHGYEVHRCVWRHECVLLALNATAQPLALRITASATERYNLYRLSRPQSPQALWQWAQATVRQQARARRRR